MRHQTLAYQRRVPVEAVLARITTDADFRQRVKDDPASALNGLAVNPASAAPGEVVGYWCSQTCVRSCRISCVTK